MSTSHNKIPIQITGGVNSQWSEDSLQPGEVENATNFLFEDGEAFTRPGLLTGIASALDAGEFIIYMQQYSDLASKGTVVFFVTRDAAGAAFIYKVSLNAADTSAVTISSVTKLAGPALAINGSVPVSSTVVDTKVLIAGLLPFVLWDPAGGVYTTPAGANVLYITGLGGRAVGADGAGNVLWSASGDPSNWTTLDSGSALIADIVGTCFGVGTVNNVLVVATDTGFHLGTLTGQAPPVGPVFAFQPFERDGLGARYGGFAGQTLAFGAEGCYFVNDVGVYFFDLQKITPVGDQIYADLIATGPQFYRGFITYTHLDIILAVGLNALPPGGYRKARSHVRYHLVPSAPTLNTTSNARIFYPYLVGQPHFILNVDKGTWSKHSYKFGIKACCENVLAGGVRSVLLADTSTPTNLYAWSPAVPQENGAFLLGAVTTIEDLERDFNVIQALLKYRDFGQSQGVRVTISCTQQDRIVAATDVQIVGTVETTFRWMRQYFNFTGVKGQLFQWRIDVDPGIQFSTNYISLRYADAGEFRQIIGTGNDTNVGASI